MLSKSYSMFVRLCPWKDTFVSDPYTLLEPRFQRWLPWLSNQWKTFPWRFFALLDGFFPRIRLKKDPFSHLWYFWPKSNRKKSWRHSRLRSEIFPHAGIWTSSVFAKLRNPGETNEMIADIHFTCIASFKWWSNIQNRGEFFLHFENTLRALWTTCV